MQEVCTIRLKQTKNKTIFRDVKYLWALVQTLFLIVTVNWPELVDDKPLMGTSGESGNQ